MFKIIDKIEKFYDLNIICVFQGKIQKCNYISNENQDLVERLMKKRDFTGKKGEVLKIEFIENNNLISLAFLGFGEENKFNLDIYREVVFDILSKEKGDILISSNDSKLSNCEVVGEIVGNVNYLFESFKKEKKQKIHVDLFQNDIHLENIEEIITLNIASNIARDLVDQPANIINPISLTQRVLGLSKEYEFQVEVLDEKECEKLGMNLFLAVGRASITKPKFIVMRYLNGDTQHKIALIGKGLTFDSGGLCIKPADSMATMKVDMGGAASVIGAMCAIAKSKLKKNVIAIVPACENAINGNAYRPGDILESMNGNTVEIVNTDAEGRLALADSITYAIREEGVHEIIDVATLTGAITIALGLTTTGVYSNNDSKYKILEAACDKYGEKIWRMPLFSEYAELIKSDVADLKNSGGRLGGSITAAKFLEAFVENNIPWIHMDIAGTVHNTGIKWFNKGATGVGVKPLYYYVKNS